MSDIVEKTLASLPKILGESLLRGPPSPRKTTSRGFQNFIRLVNKARSKQEEEHVVKHELMLIQQQLSHPDTNQVCDNLCRVFYCGMLGYDVTFAYIHAIKLAQNATTIIKRIGYLTSSLLLHEDHELILLLINTIQKDLQSSNLLHNCIALNAVCQLVNSEMVPMILPLVQEKLRHPRELVRVKAVTCMHRFVLKTPSLVQHCLDQFKACLCDKDPGVMSIAVNIYYHLVKRNPENFHSLVPVLVNILQQIVNGILPASFEYHSIPLPWLQIQILRTLAILGAKNIDLSEQMYSVLKDVLQRVNIKEYMAFGIMYECIATITSIYPNEELLQEAAKCVGRFIRSSDHNLKYIGVKSLTSLVKGRPESALDYQMIVVELLDDPDYAIQRKTLELLFNMANPVNVQVVCDRLLDHMNKSSNKYWQMDIVVKVTSLADRFSSSGQWYVDTMIKLLQLNKTSIPYGVVNKVITAVQKGCLVDDGSENNTNPKEFKQHLIKKCVECLFKDDLCKELLQVSIWVLGEFADLLKNMPEDRLISLFIKQFTRPSLDVGTKLWIVSTMLKLTFSKILSSAVINRSFLDIEKREENSLLKQKLRELIKCAEVNPDIQVLWTKNGGKTSQMDFTLSFLDDFVSDSLEKGAAPYKPCYIRRAAASQTSDTKSVFSGLNLQPYSTQSPGSSASASASGPRPTGDSLSSGGMSESSQNLPESGLNLKGVKRVWGKEGFLGQEKDIIGGSVQTQHQPADSTVNITGVQQHSFQEMKMDAKKKELVSALFGGISPQKKSDSSEILSRDSIGSESKTLENEKMRSENESSTLFKSSLFTHGHQTESEHAQILPKIDSGGWRKLHEQGNDLNSDQVELSPLDTSNNAERRQSSQLLDECPETSNVSFSNSNVENIDFMNLSVSSTHAPETDYFNPVTGNWELDINTETNEDVSLKSQNKSDINISEMDIKYSPDNDEMFLDGGISENKYAFCFYTSSDNPSNEKILSESPPLGCETNSTDVAAETETIGSLYDDFKE